MCDLYLTASRFFIYLLIQYVATICITSLYRMFAALSPTIDDAVRFSGIALNLLVIFTGYVIPKTQLLGDYIWFGSYNIVAPFSPLSALTNTSRQDGCIGLFVFLFSSLVDYH